MPALNPPLRRIYVHMIEETARHAGHAILREQTDAVGFDG